MYDPAIGRFLSRDAYYEGVTSAMAFNPFTYCRNSPLVFTDPDGNFFFLIPIIAGAVVGAYMGGTLANNGNLNPFQWNYNAKTWTYMAIGGVLGGIGGGLSAYSFAADYTAMTNAGVSSFWAGVSAGAGAGYVSSWFSTITTCMLSNPTGQQIGTSVLLGTALGALAGGLGSLAGLPSAPPAISGPGSTGAGAAAGLPANLAQLASAPARALAKEMGSAGANNVNQYLVQPTNNSTSPVIASTGDDPSWYTQPSRQPSYGGVTNNSSKEIRVRLENPTGGNKSKPIGPKGSYSGRIDGVKIGDQWIKLSDSYSNMGITVTDNGVFFCQDQMTYNFISNIAKGTVQTIINLFLTKPAPVNFNTILTPEEAQSLGWE